MFKPDSHDHIVRGLVTGNPEEWGAEKGKFPGYAYYRKWA